MLRAERESRVPLARRVAVFFLCLLLWMLLAGEWRVDELVAGALAALLVTALSGERLAAFAGLRATPGMPIALLAFVGRFMLALVRANLDVARRVLSPSLPLDPAIVEIETALHSPLARLLLANAITLTPGTLTVDMEGSRLRIHWIDAPPGLDMQAATERIAADFERHLAGFLQ